MIKVTGPEGKIRCGDLNIGQFFVWKGKLKFLYKKTENWNYYVDVVGGKELGPFEDEDGYEEDFDMDDFVDLVDVNITWSFK